MHPTKELARGFGLWFARIMFVLTVVLWACIYTAYCQHSEFHTEVDEWEDSLRVKVIEVTDITGDEIHWRKNTRLRVALGVYNYDQSLKVDRDFTKNPKGCYQVWYCQTHYFAYMLSPVESKHCRR